MSTFTCTSRIKSKVDVTDRFDMSTFNPCTTHGRKPTIFEISWGRNNRAYTAECESEECLVLGGLNPDPKEVRWNKWNRFNPLPEAATAVDVADEFCERVSALN